MKQAQIRKKLERATLEAGVVPRALQAVFEHIQRGSDTAHQFRLSLAVLQIYLDQVQDMLATTGIKNLKIRDVQNGKGTFIENLSWRFISSTGEGVALLKEALYQRTHRETSANPTSSRSHLIVKLRVEQRRGAQPPIAATLTFVDLAGWVNSRV